MIDRDRNDPDDRDSNGLRTVSARRWSDWEKSQRDIASEAEPIVAKLKCGKNYLPPTKFRAVAIYLFGDNEGHSAQDIGSFTIGRIEVIRASWRDGDRVTLSRLAQIAGLSERHMRTLLKEANVPFEKSGREKLYSFADMESLRDYFAK